MNDLQMQTRLFRVAADRPEYHLEAVCVRCGDDLVVVIGGGERYHVGAVALTIHVPSLKDPRKPAYSSYLTPVPGHKEEELAREGCLRLAKALHTNVTLTAGIHLDDIDRAGIQRFVDLFHRLIAQIEAAYRAEPFRPPDEKDASASPG